jgi:hypothetical protein
MAFDIEDDSSDYLTFADDTPVVDFSSILINVP